MKTANWVMLFLMLSALPTRGQEEVPAAGEQDANPFHRAYICSLGDDFAATAAAPFRFSKRQWAISGSVAAGSLLLFSQEENIRQSFQKFRKPWSNQLSEKIFEPIDQLSPTNPLLLTMGSIYGTALLIKNKRLQKATLTSFKAIAVSGVLVNIIKLSTGRARPSLEKGHNDWFNNPLKSENRSFISGHTIITFSIASSFAHAYKDKPWVGLLGYSIAGLAGLSRIHDDKHWASDVFIGAALGWSIGRLIVRSDHWSLRISESGGSPTAGLAYQF